MKISIYQLLFFVLLSGNVLSQESIKSWETLKGIIGSQQSALRNQLTRQSFKQTDKANYEGLTIVAFENPNKSVNHPIFGAMDDYFNFISNQDNNLIAFNFLFGEKRGDLMVASDDYAAFEKSILSDGFKLIKNKSETHGETKLFVSRDKKIKIQVSLIHPGGGMIKSAEIEVFDAAYSDRFEVEGLTTLTTVTESLTHQA